MDWNELFQKEELYEYVEKVSDGTENKYSMKALEVELERNTTYKRCLSVCLIWDFWDEERQTSFALTQVGEFNCSRFLILMDFWSKVSIEKRIWYDVHFRSIFRIRQQLRRVLEVVDVADIPILRVSDEVNDSALSKSITISINDTAIEVFSSGDNNYYHLSDGRVGKIEKINTSK